MSRNTAPAAPSAPAPNTGPRVCQSGNRMPASLHPIFVMCRLTLRCLLIIGTRCRQQDSGTAGNRYADLLLASFVYIFEEGVVHVSKQ